MNICQISFRRVFILFSAISVFSSAATIAQYDVYTSATRYQFDQISPVNLVEPERPATRFGPGPEGWIKLRFSIKADGTTSNIEVLDYMPSTFSRRDTIRAVEQWTFEPAVLDGNAIDWHNNIVVVNFDLPEIPNISGPQFTMPYSQVQELLAQGRLDRAEKDAIDNLKNTTFSLHDIGLGNMQLTTVEMQLKDMHLAYQAIERATLPGISQLTDEELDVALQYRFNIEIAIGRYVEALNTYDRRQALSSMPDDDNMHEKAELIQNALDQAYNLSAKGKILDRESGWFFIPSRRTFTITDTDGDLDSIEAVCNMRRISMEYQPDVEWSLPESWGECSLTVMGDRNTTFSFYEFSQ